MKFGCEKNTKGGEKQRNKSTMDGKRTIRGSFFSLFERLKRWIFGYNKVVTQKGLANFRNINFMILLEQNPEKAST